MYYDDIYNAYMRDAYTNPEYPVQGYGYPAQGFGYPAQGYGGQGQAYGYPAPMNQMPMTGGMSPMYPAAPIGTTLPTGLPAGPMMAPIPGPGLAPGTVDTDITSPTSVQYLAGYLKTQIGKRVKIEFLIGTNSLLDRDGTLLSVGVSYVILREAESDDLLVCDLYSIKFVRIYL